MAKLVKIAAPLFKSERYRGTPEGQKVVLDEVHKQFEEIQGQGVDLVVFSEGVEAIGQTVETAEAFDKPGPILNAYKEFAKSEKCHIAGSVKYKENDNIHNSIAYIDDNGQPLGVYHKVFLTDKELEWGMIPGQKAVVIESKVGRLGGAICFDLNFDELRKQYVNLKPDILTFASMYHGGLMQGVWAYDCRSFFVSALPFLGGGILNPHGAVLNVTDCYTSIAMTTVNLDRVMIHLDHNREKFLDIKRAYGDEITLDIPSNIGSAILYSNSDARTAMDIVREYELVLLDDYFDRMRKENDIKRSMAD